MSRILVIVVLASLTTACTIPTYEAEPVSVYQWERRQEQIQRNETERLNRCQSMNKESERYARECQRPGGATQ